MDLHVSVKFIKADFFLSFTQKDRWIANLADHSGKRTMSCRNEQQLCRNHIIKPQIHVMLPNVGQILLNMLIS